MPRPQSPARPTSLFANRSAICLCPENDAKNARTPRILLVDDSEAMRDMVLTILRVAGFEAHGASNGAQAVAEIRQKAYDLVLMDIEMPEMDGLTTTRTIRALAGTKNQVPIIAFTGNITLDDQERFYQSGMNDFAAKPIAANELVALVERWTNTAPPTKKSQSGPPLFEPMPLAELEAVVGFQAMIDLLILFDETAGKHANAIRRAVHGRNADALARNAHDLKSIAGNCGFSRLSRHAAAIETACLEEEHTYAFALARRADKILAESRAFLKATYPDVYTRHKAFG